MPITKVKDNSYTFSWFYKKFPNYYFHSLPGPVNFPRTASWLINYSMDEVQNLIRYLVRNKIKNAEASKSADMEVTNFELNFILFSRDHKT